MALRALDLMIGDWVKVTDDDTDDSFIGQVKAIDELENINVQEGEDVAYPYSIDCLEPIPLTPEILEKNGFKYNEHPFVQGYEQFGLVLYHGGDGYRINCGQNVALQLDSVHQLQHALRLCGIDKEIEL